jgi:hypothetical protein
VGSGQQQGRHHLDDHRHGPGAKVKDRPRAVRCDRAVWSMVAGTAAMIRAAKVTAPGAAR